MNEEIWKEIEGYESKYLISNMGRIRVLLNNSKPCDYIKNQYLCKKGYKRTTLINSEGKVKTIRVHRIVANTFIDKVENKEQVNHINGIKTDNRVENLEWVNNTENQRHAWELGLVQSKKGSSNRTSKLTECQVLEIRSLRSRDGEGMKLKELSQLYGVSETKISRIVRYLDWKHI